MERPLFLAHSSRMRWIAAALCLLALAPSLIAAAPIRRGDTRPIYLQPEALAEANTPTEKLGNQWWAPGPERFYGYALQDLRDYLQRVTGARHPLTADDPAATSGIVAGTQAQFPAFQPRQEAARRAAASADPEAFLIEVQGDKLYILGKSNAGLMAAVYTLLDRLGCKWFAPGKRWESVPELNGLTLDASLNTASAGPSYQVRTLFNEPDGEYKDAAGDYLRDTPHNNQWQRRNRLGGPNLVRITDGAVSALDGAAEQGYAPLLPGPQWVRIDLGQHFEVSKVQAWHYFNDGRTYRDVVVQLSHDAEFVDEVATVFNNDADNTLFRGAGKDAEYAETKRGKEVAVRPPVVARYVRLWSNGSTANAGNHYPEVRVFGAPAPASKVPAPATQKVGRRAATKKLIAFPRTVEPYPAFMRKHIAEMEKTPFDGTVFLLKYTKADGSEGVFSWENWGKAAFKEEQLKPALEDLKATRFTRFKHNFLRFNTASKDHDWFDDFSAIVNNARLAASLVHQANEATGAFPGIKFDSEQYNDKLFTYASQRDKATKSFEQYAAQVRKRGREVMEAFQEGYPGLTVFMSIGYSGAWYEAQRGKPLAECDYGLLAAFMDGMTEAAKGKTRIVDGYELGYYLEPETLHFGYRAMAQDLLPIVADVKKYREVTSLGLGLWLDKNHDTWNAQEVSKNHWTPERFETLVRKALEVSDEYVWVYSDKKPQWWSEDGTPRDIPPAYFESLRRARQGLAVD